MPFVKKIANYLSVNWSQIGLKSKKWKAIVVSIIVVFLATLTLCLTAYFDLPPGEQRWKFLRRILEEQVTGVLED